MGGLDPPTQFARVHARKRFILAQTLGSWMAGSETGHAARKKRRRQLQRRLSFKRNSKPYCTVTRLTVAPSALRTPCTRTLAPALTMLLSASVNFVTGTFGSRMRSDSPAGYVVPAPPIWLAPNFTFMTLLPFTIAVPVTVAFVIV